MAVQRFDRHEFKPPVRTGAGGLRIDATIARTGVQLYRRADGREIREYRPESEVFNADSLASIAGVPLTIRHPSEIVTPANWERLAVGHASDAAPVKVEDDGAQWIGLPLTVARQDAVQAVDARALVELSAGYTCDLELTPGTSPNGERYDAIQRNIRFNHIALLPPGEARAGSGARLRLDGNQEIQDEGPRKMLIKIGNVEVEQNSPAHVALLEDAGNRAVSAMNAEKARADAAEKSRDEEKARADAAEKAAKDAIAAIPAQVADAIDARSKAAAVLAKDYDFQGKTSEQIRRDALEIMTPGAIAKDTPADAVRAAFDVAIKLRADAKPPEQRHDYNGGKAPEKRDDSKDAPVSFAEALQRRADAIRQDPKLENAPIAG